MVRSKKILTFVLILSMAVTVIMTGCGSDNTESEKAVKYDFSVFFGSMKDAMKIDSLLTKYEKETGIKIEPIIASEGEDDVSAMESLLEEDDAPAAYAASKNADMEYLSGGGFVADLSKLDSSMKSDSFPYIAEGYGLAYDRSVFNEIFGESTANTLISDLKECGYEGWMSFVKALDAFIKGNGSESFIVGGNTYKFPDKKGTLAKDLNGVYAIPGADSQVYGYDLMSLVTQNVDLDSWEKVKEETTESAIETMDPALMTYINGLDSLTSYLAGEYDSGIRGSDFVNEDYYNKQKTDVMFMDGKAMFSIIDNHEYSVLKDLNAKKAQSLAFLPIKMPYDDSFGGKTVSGAGLNSSIPSDMAYSLYVNGNCSEKIQKEALDFLKWFTAREDKWMDPLSASVKDYVTSGDMLKYDYLPEELEDWESTIFDEGGIRQYLKKSDWSDEYKYEMEIFMAESWCED